MLQLSRPAHNLRQGACKARVRGGRRAGLGTGTARLGILLPFFSLSGFASVSAMVSARCVYTGGNMCNYTAGRLPHRFLLGVVPAVDFLSCRVSILSWYGLTWKFESPCGLDVRC